MTSTTWKFWTGCWSGWGFGPDSVEQIPDRPPLAPVLVSTLDVLPAVVAQVAARARRGQIQCIAVGEVLASGGRRSGSWSRTTQTRPVMWVLASLTPVATSTQVPYSSWITGSLHFPHGKCHQSVWRYSASIIAFNRSRNSSFCNNDRNGPTKDTNARRWEILTLNKSFPDDETKLRGSGLLPGDVPVTSAAGAHGKSRSNWLGSTASSSNCRPAISPASILGINATTCS